VNVAKNMAYMKLARDVGRWRIDGVYVLSAYLIVKIVYTVPLPVLVNFAMI